MRLMAAARMARQWDGRLACPVAVLNFLTLNRNTTGETPVPLWFRHRTDGRREVGEVAFEREVRGEMGAEAFAAFEHEHL